MGWGGIQHITHHISFPVLIRYKDPRSLRHMTPTAPSKALFVVPSRIPSSSGTPLTQRFGPCLPPRDLFGSPPAVFDPCSWLAGRVVRFIPRGGVASFPPFRRTVGPEDVPSRWSGRLGSRVCRVSCLRMGVRFRGWLPRGSFCEVLDPIFCTCVAMRRSALMRGPTSSGSVGTEVLVDRDVCGARLFHCRECLCEDVCGALGHVLRAMTPETYLKTRDLLRKGSCGLRKDGRGRSN